MAKRIIIAVTNDLVTDQRVSRIADTLLNTGYNIELVGRVLSNSQKLSRKYKTKRFKLWFNKGALFYVNYNLRLFIYLLFNKFDIILSNDLDTLLSSFFISKIRKKICIYDSHEYFTEVPELVNRRIQKGIWEIIEKITLPNVEYCYTVSKSIADEYFVKYNKKFDVIRNLPLKKQVIHKKKENIIIYQGALNIGRGIELMIDSMFYIPDYVLWIIGSGDIDKELKLLTKQKGLNNRIKFFGRLSLEKLKDITYQAKIGLSFEEDLGKNYRFALPNKLFDYIQANIPVLVSDLPEMKNVVKQYNIGEVIAERNPKQIAKQILKIVEDADKYTQYLKIASEELCWENEKGKLLNIFKKALYS